MRCSRLMLVRLAKPLPRLGKRPPRLRLTAVHEGDDRHYYVDHAWVVATAGGPAKLFVKFQRITTDQLLGLVDADQPQISRAGLANIWQVFKFNGAGSDDFFRMHPGVVIDDVSGL